VLGAVRARVRLLEVAAAVQPATAGCVHGVHIEVQPLAVALEDLAGDEDVEALARTRHHPHGAPVPGAFERLLEVERQVSGFGAPELRRDPTLRETLPVLFAHASFEDLDPDVEELLLGDLALGLNRLDPLALVVVGQWHCRRRRWEPGRRRRPGGRWRRDGHGRGGCGRPRDLPDASDSDRDLDGRMKELRPGGHERMARDPAGTDHRGAFGPVSRRLREAGGPALGTVAPGNLCDRRITRRRQARQRRGGHRDRSSDLRHGSAPDSPLPRL
jgi:hypothetical protein